jgi:phosphatidate phosphatase APP1
VVGAGFVRPAPSTQHPAPTTQHPPPGTLSHPLQIHSYRTYGTRSRVLVAGRVLEDEGITAGAVGDSHWRNLVGILKRIESDEVPGARVRVAIGGTERELVADNEGHFAAWIALAEPLPSDVAWHEASSELLHPPSPTGKVVRGAGLILVPPASARFAVISDIDDTVVRTHATDLLRMARQIFLGNAHTRLPFPGVAAFYRELLRGTMGQESNPIFYVSSSPWNFYDILIEFLELQRIPLGPLLLRDWGVTRGTLPIGHKTHKLNAIRSILETYPALPVILIGDSGQEDPEIYARVVRDFPRRVLAVYIRNVTSAPERSRALWLLSEQVLASGSVLILADDTLAAARHAAEHGWIDPASLDAIAADKRQDETAPAPGDDPASPSAPPSAPTIVVEGERPPNA